MILQEQPERQQPLAKLVAFTHREMVARDERSPSNSQILPYVVRENARAMRLASALQARGFDIRGMRPPTGPAGTSAVSCCRRASRAGQLMSVAQHFLRRRNVSTCGTRLARLDRKLDAFEVNVVHGQQRAETEVRTTGTSRIQYGT